MTSSAISLLTTVTAPAPQGTANDQVGQPSKTDAPSFSETLQKADKSQSGLVSAKPVANASVDKPKATQGTKTADAASDPATLEADSPMPSNAAEPKVSAANEVGQAAEHTPPAPPVKSAPVTSTKPGANEADLKPVKDEDAIAPTESPVPAVVVAPAPVNDVAAMLSAQALPQGQSTDVKDPAGADENKLGTSILASINMGKSLDKPAAGQNPIDVLTKPESELTTSSKDALTTEAGTTAALSPAQTAKATQAASDAAVTASAPVMQNVAETPQIKTTVEKVSDRKSGESQPQLESLSSASPVAASAQSVGSQGSSSTTASATLQTPVNNPDWAKNLGQQLVNFHLKGDQNVQLHLNPSNLGPMSITLNVNEHLQATAHFASHSGQVRSALEQGIGQLREAMAQQGISLGETSVGEQRQQSFSQSGDSQAQRGNIQQLPGMTVVADETTSLPAASVVGDGEISTYA